MSQDLKKAVLRACIFFFITGALLRLPFLNYPHQVVFDEVYFGKFLSEYCCTHVRFFDIHPPHGKLILALFAKFGGYQGGFPFDKISQDYGSVPVFFLRLAPALAGMVMPIVLLLLMLELGAAFWTAFAVAFFALFDCGLWVQTRIIALDGFLLLGIFLSLLLYLRAEGATSYKEKFCYYAATGASLCLAIGTKFTGITALFLIGLIALDQTVESRRYQDIPRKILGLSVIFGVFAVLYLIGWYLHFYLLPTPGSGDAFYKPTGNFLVDTFKLHKVMFDANAGVSGDHPYASRWWVWPFIGRPIFYWQEGVANIYFTGNPVTWWVSISIFICALLTMMIRDNASRLSFGEDPKGLEKIIWLPLIAYAVAYFPNAMIHRPLFLYHYLPPLFFCCMFSFLWLERIGWIEEGTSPTSQRWPYWVLLGSCAAAFVVMLPITSGIYAGTGIRNWFFGIFPHWR